MCQEAFDTDLVRKFIWHWVETLVLVVYYLAHLHYTQFHFVHLVEMVFQQEMVAAKLVKLLSDIANLLSTYLLQLLRHLLELLVCFVND